MKKRVPLVLMLCLIPAVAAAQGGAPPPSSSEGMPRTGLVIDARLGVATPVAASAPTSGLGGAFVVLPSVDIGVRLIGRLQLTLGFTLFRAAQSVSGGPDTSQTSFLLVPGVACDIVKSSDEKVAFYGAGGIPMGALLFDRGGGAAGSTLKNFAVGYNIAVGVRYAPHPMFAFGLEGGLFGIFSDLDNANRIGITSVYGSLVGTWYYDFGKK
jgi:hypothetical protein